MPEQQQDGRVKCCQCGEIFKRIGIHWSHSASCSFLPLSNVKKEMLVGSLMGDGWMHSKQYKNQGIVVAWSSKEQCQWLDSEFGWLSTGVSLHMTAEEVAQNCRKRLGRNTVSQDCSDSYRVRTRTHPEITKLTSWYSTGEKVWPDGLDLTPTTLLLWFVGDGSYEDSGTERRIAIGMSNEANNTEKVYQYFDVKNLPRPSNDHDGKHPTWTVSGSKQLFEYMSRSPAFDGAAEEGVFGYKFPKEYGGTGKSMDDVEVTI